MVASIRGYCFGVGFELSLACDFRIVSETAEFALPEQRIGMIPGSGGSARLARMIGIARTKDIAMRSRRIPARQAYEWGIAVECVPDAELEAGTGALADELRGFSPLAQRTLKGVLNASQDAPLGVAIELEGTGLRPAALLGRLPRRRRIVLRQAQAGVQGNVSRPRSGNRRQKA